MELRQSQRQWRYENAAAAMATIAMATGKTAITVIPRPSPKLPIGYAAGATNRATSYGRKKRIDNAKADGKARKNGKKNGKKNGNRG
jgi:hypothetical protein